MAYCSREEYEELRRRGRNDPYVKAWREELGRTEMPFVTQEKPVERVLVRAAVIAEHGDFTLIKVGLENILVQKTDIIRP